MCKIGPYGNPFPVKYFSHSIIDGKFRFNFLVKPALTASTLLGLLLLNGCGKPPETVPSHTPETTPHPVPSKPSVVVQPPVNSPAPTSTPTPAGRVVYVVTGFQAMNSDGTHDVPNGAAVNVLAEEGDEYLIEFQGISVRTPKTYFSESLVEETKLTEETSPPADAIPLETTPPAVSAQATPDTPTPSAAPDAAMAVDEKKATELIGEIRTLNDQIRQANDQMEVAPQDEKASEAARIEKLKKRRDALSENLTEFAKP